LQSFRQIGRIALAAVWHFAADDGWAIASHIALSTLMAMFPFLIVVTALAGFFFGSKDLADEAARILLEAWPAQVAGPIATDVTNVLTDTHGGVLTFGLLFAIYFASSGVESLRIGLNRAYDMAEARPWWLLRLEAILYVLIGAVAILVFAFMVVFAPAIWNTLVIFAPKVQPFSGMVTFARYAVAVTVLIVSLLVMHIWLPAGKRRLREIAPGIVATLLMWLVAGAAFGRYLADYAFAYTTMYGGLASAMIALVFLYLCATIFIFGAELNSTIVKERQGLERGPPDEKAIKE
jgi:membrane protein